MNNRKKNINGSEMEVQVVISDIRSEIDLETVSQPIYNKSDCSGQWEKSFEAE